MKHATHKGNLVNLKKIEGQVRGLQAMIEEEKYCVDILNQLKGEDVDIAGVDFSIENDPNLQEAVTNRQRNIRTKASIRQANPNLSPRQIDTLAAIQDQIDVLETNKTITGKNKKKDLTNQYNETETAFIENPESYAKDQMQDITNTQIDNALAEQDRFISETFQNDKNFSKTVVDVLGGLGVPLNILKVSSVEDLKVALTKMGVPEEKLTPEYLQEQFTKGGLFNNGMFFVNENVISEQAKEGANLDFTYSHETVHGLSNLFIKNVPSLITELQKIIGTEQTQLVHERMDARKEAVDIEIDSNATKFSQEQKIELESTLDTALVLLEKSGAKNLLVKRDDFETENGIKGIKAYGDFYLQTSENKILKKKSTYELLLFAQENGLQEVLVIYQDDGRFTESIKDRIINSIEIEVTQENKKKNEQ